MVVDDDDTTRKVVSLFLRREGYEVISVSNGIEAVERLSIESFDLVLSDFAMPGMDGLNLTRHIHSVAPQTLIIVMSGHVSMNREDVMNVGGVDFIRKPIVLTELLAKIELAFATGVPQNGSRSTHTEGRQFIG